MKTYNETRYAVHVPTSKTNEDGTPEVELKQYTEGDYAKKEEAHKNGKGDHPGEVQKMATFVYNEPESDAEIAQLVPDEVERVNIFNRGYVLKQQRLVIDHTTDLEDQAGVSAAHDLTAEAAVKSERRKMTPADKALKALSALSPDEIAKILSQFTAAQAA